MTKRKELLETLDEMSEEEVQAVEAQLNIVSETCKAHLLYMEETTDPHTLDDLGLCVLEEAYLFLHQFWLEQRGTTKPKQTLHS